MIEPEEDGFFWAMIYGDWQPVQKLQGCLYSFGSDDSEMKDVQEWGPKIKMPKELKHDK